MYEEILSFSSNIIVILQYILILGIDKSSAKSAVSIVILVNYT